MICSGPHGGYMGCITEYLGPSRDEYIIPKFAKYCSALCYYRETPEKLTRIHDCPFNGTRIDSADDHLGQPSPQTTTEASNQPRGRPRPTRQPRPATTTLNLIKFFSRSKNCQRYLKVLSATYETIATK